MYLHIGLSYVIDTRNIVGIFDIEKTSCSGITREFLSEAQKSGKIITATSELPKSYIVCSEGKKTSVYLSQLSTGTLQKREISGVLLGLSEE